MTLSIRDTTLYALKCHGSEWLLKSCAPLSNNLFSENLAKFRSLDESTYYGYREGLIRTTTVMIRFLHWRKKPQKAKKLGKFTLTDIWDNSEKDAAHALRKLFIKSEGVPLRTDLQAHMHRLYDALMRSAESSTKTGSPAEVAICIACMEADNRWRRASYAAQLCCRLCFGIRCIWVHSARLEIEGSDVYTEYSPSAPPPIAIDVNSPVVAPSEDAVDGLELTAGLDELYILDEEDSDDESQTSDIGHIDSINKIQANTGAISDDETDSDDGSQDESLGDKPGAQAHSRESRPKSSSQYQKVLRGT